MRRKKPDVEMLKLRKQDWEPTIVLVDDLPKTIDEAKGGLVKVVVWAADSEEAEAARIMLRDCPKIAAKVMWRDAEGETKVPKESEPGGRVTIAKVGEFDVQSEGEAAPRVRGMGTNVHKRAEDAKKSVRLRVSIEAKFIEDFDRLVKEPRRWLAPWAQKALPGSLCAEILDVWGFNVEARPRGKAVVCLARVPSEALDKIRKCIGSGGVFLAPVDRSGVTQAKVEWFTAVPGMSWAGTAAEALKRKPALGLTLGERQVGLLHVAGAADATRRTWEIAGAPLWWTDHTATECIAQEASAQDCKVVRRQRRGRSVTYWVQGAAKEAKDTVAIVTTADDSDDVVTIWARKAPPRTPATRTVAPISARGPDWLPLRAPATLRTERKSDGNAPEEKRTKTDRDVPNAFDKQSVPGDGACLFWAVGYALKHLSGKDVDVSSRRVRAEVVQYLEKNASAFREVWDGQGTGGQKYENFEAYLKAMSGSTMHGGALEL